MRRTKIAEGDSKAARPLGRSAKSLPNMQKRVYYQNPKTNQIAVVPAGQRLSPKSGFQVCSLDDYRTWRWYGAKPVPVSKPAAPVAPPKLDAKRAIAGLLSLNRKQRRRLPHVAHA